jgi:hypothetical protein
MGVLLHVQTMDRPKLELLGSDPLDREETMERGMEFLKAASQTSNLAGRYVAMLQRIMSNKAKHGNTRPHLNNNITDHSNHEVTSSSLQRNNAPDVTTSQAIPPPQTPLQQPQTPTAGLQNLQDDVASLAGMNLDDWLLGVGLPQNFLSLDYANGGFLL